MFTTKDAHKSFLTANDDDFVLIDIVKSSISELHKTAASGNVRRFYKLLIDFETSHPLEHNFSSWISQCINPAGQTPWHLAAQEGHAEFFVKPSDPKEIKIWKVIKKAWLNAQDKEGKTALHFAAENGLPTTVQTLMCKKETDPTLLDNENQSAYALAMKHGHQLTATELASAAKERKIDLLNIPDEKVSPIIYAAKNHHLHDDEFKNLLKKVKSLSCKDEDGEEVNIIDLRIATLRNKNRGKNLRTILLGTMCPASTLAISIGTLGGINIEPLSASFLSLAALTIIYPITAYFCYAARSKEYGKVASETLFQSWQAARLAKYNEKLKEHNLAISRLKTAVAKTENADDLKVCSQSLQRLQHQQEHLERKGNKFYSATSGLFNLRYLSANDMRSKLELAVHDPKSNSQWTGSMESVKAFFAYNSDIFCPVGAGLTIGASFVGLGTKLGILGAIGFLSGPVGIAIATIVATAVLTGCIGWALYKASYKKEKAEMGTVNRELVSAYFEVKKNFNEPQQRSNYRSLGEIKENIQRKRENFAKQAKRKEARHSVTMPLSTSITDISLFNATAPEMQRLVSCPPNLNVGKGQSI